MAECDFMQKVKERFDNFWKLAVSSEENQTASNEKYCGLLENLIQDLKTIQSRLQQKHEKTDTQISEKSLNQAEAMDVDNEIDVTTEETDMDNRPSVPNSVDTTLDSPVFDNIKEVLKNNADTLDKFNDNKEHIRTRVTEEEKRTKRYDCSKKSFRQDLNLATNSEAKLDPNLVQIRASKSEIERRIAAFIEQKRLEVDEENQREFCSHVPKLENGVFSIGTDEGKRFQQSALSSFAEDSCARTDAVFYPRAGGKSHIKVSRVINAYGPQTQRFQTSYPEALVALPLVKSEPQSVPEGTEERITNMELHLKIKNNIPKADMYSRLKALESRILFLESLSPEYFPSVPSLPPKRQRLMMKTAFSSRNLQEKELSLPDIDERMKAIRQTLQKRAIETSQKFSIKSEH